MCGDTSSYSMTELFKRRSLCFVSWRGSDSGFFRESGRVTRETEKKKRAVAVSRPGQTCFGSRFKIKVENRTVGARNPDVYFPRRRIRTLCKELRSRDISRCITSSTMVRISAFSPCLQECTCRVLASPAVPIFLVSEISVHDGISR